MEISFLAQEHFRGSNKKHGLTDCGKRVQVAGLSCNTALCRSDARRVVVVALRSLRSRLFRAVVGEVHRPANLEIECFSRVSDVNKNPEPHCRGLRLCTIVPDPTAKRAYGDLRLRFSLS